MKTILILGLLLLIAPNIVQAQAVDGQPGMPDWQTYGVPAVVWMAALVNYFKEAFNMDTRFAMPLAVGIAGLYGTGLYFSDRVEVVAVVMNILVGAILSGLAVSGYYSGTKKQVESRTIPETAKMRD